MSKELLEIEVGENTYKLGYPTREDIVKAEDMGLKLLELEEKPVKTTNMLFYTALLAKQPTITKDEAIKLLNQYIEEGGEIGEINSFLMQQYVAFQKSPNGKKKKKAKIIKI
jgi:hypothetical protein